MTIENDNLQEGANAETAAPEKTADQLASERNLDLAIEPDQQGEQAAETAQKSVIDANTAIKEVLTVVPMGLHMAGLKNAAAAWSDDACGAVSSALVPVLRKYAFGQRILAYLETGGGMAEGVLLMALWPVASATYAGYLQDKEEINKKIVLEKNAKLFEGFEENPQAGKVYEAGTERGSTFKFNYEGTP